MRIVKNAARCKRCGDIIESEYTHDFKFCKCGAIAVDGGHSYIKRCFKYSPTDIEDMSEYEDEDDS